MKVRYKGPSFGVDGLTDEKVYTCIGIEYGNLRIIDDSGEDYLYSAISPGPCDDKNIQGEWEIIEDDERGSIQKLIKRDGE